MSSKECISQNETMTCMDRNIDLKDSNKENEDLDITSAKDPFLPSGRLEVCDMETNQIIKQTQQGHRNTPELHNDIQTAGEIMPESYIAEDSKTSPNKEGSPEQVQPLQTLVIEKKNHNKCDAKMKKDENCQPSEGEKLETACEVLQDLSRKKGTEDGSGDRNANVQENNAQQTPSDKRLRPNYFVAIPVTNDEILDLIEDVQEHIVLKEPKLLRALIPAEKVHITILVAHLRTEEDIRRAIAALLQSKEKVEKLLHGKPFELTLHGIGEFNNQVIYIKIKEQECELLSKVAEIVKQSFIDAGVNITGSKDFKPHLTFLKLSKVPSLRRKVH